MGLRDLLTCPFDAPLEIVERPLGDLERHMGLKHDAQHIAWRIKHGLPADMNLHTMHERRQEIRLAIVADWEKFMPRKRDSRG